MNTMISNTATVRPASVQAVTSWRRDSIGDSVAQLLRWLGVAVGIVHLVAQLYVFIPIHWARTDTHRDVAVYYDAAQAVRTHAALYQLHPQWVPRDIPIGHLYPPIFAVAIAPLGLVSFVTFARIWYGLLLVAFWAFATLLARLATRRWSVMDPIIVGGLLAATTLVYPTLSMGNVEPILWLGAALVVVWAPCQGLLLGIMTCIKLHPGWALAAAVGHDKRQAYLAGSIIAFLLALTIVFVGIWPFRIWATQIAPGLSQGGAGDHNGSISFGLLRLLHQFGWISFEAPLPFWAKAWLAGWTLAVMGTTWRLTHNRSPQLHVASLLAAGWCSGALCWSTYYVMVALPLAVWIGERGWFTDGQ
jgi:hypothetical protein